MLEIRYIDDEYGDSVTGILPAYNGSRWAQGATCSTCSFRPDPSKTFNGTWHSNIHESMDPPSIVGLKFTGITLDVYCLIPPNLNPIVMTEYSLTFILDGEPLDKTFIYNILSLDIQYNVSVLSLTNLTQVPHTFAMIAAAPGITTTIQFDYAIYTVNTSLLPSVSSFSSTSDSSTVSLRTPTTASLSSTPSSSTPTSSSSNLPTVKPHSSLATAISASFGVVLFLVLIILLIFYYRRYKHRIRRPFIPSTMMQEVEDPRGAKRAMAEEMWRQEELGILQQEVTELPSSPTHHSNIGPTSRTSLVAHLDTSEHKEGGLIEEENRRD